MFVIIFRISPTAVAQIETARLIRGVGLLNSPAPSKETAATLDNIHLFPAFLC